MKPDRIVVGAFAEADAAAVSALYEPLDAPMVEVDVASAEMIKLAANAFLMTRISFINEIANVCEATGADVDEVAKGVGLDHRLGPHFLRAGIGWGGSCFPKDGVALKQLASNSGYHFQLLNAVIEVNELQKRRVIGKLEKHLGELRGKTVALLGLAFKPNTDDLREAPSLVLASRLLAEGAEVRAWDPVADASRLLQGVTFCDSVLDAVSGADAAVIVTEWDELRSLASDDVRQGDEAAGDRGRPQPARSGGRARGRVHLRGDRPRRLAARRAPRDRRARARAPGLVEAIILAGGKAERLGDAADGRPKALVEVGGRPLAAYQVEQLAAVGVDRVIVSCVAGQEAAFEAAIGNLGPEIVRPVSPSRSVAAGGCASRPSARLESGRRLAHERRRARRRSISRSCSRRRARATRRRRSPSSRSARRSAWSSSTTTS